MSLPDVLALAYALVTVGVVAFQVALALGAPWGQYAMGGAFPGRMPTPLRIAALAQGIALAALAVIVLADAGLADVALVHEWPWLIWVPVAVSAVAVVLNASTRSQGERRIWLPVATLLLICSLGVALA
jgi:cytochrome bd-type quinol oxidase subunit 2